MMESDRSPLSGPVSEKSSHTSDPPGKDTANLICPGKAEEIRETLGMISRDGADRRPEEGVCSLVTETMRS